MYSLSLASDDALSHADAQLVQLMCPPSQRAALLARSTRSHSSIVAGEGEGVANGNNAPHDDAASDDTLAPFASSSPTPVLRGALYLGSAADAHDERTLAALGIDVLVNCAAEIASGASKGAAAAAAAAVTATAPGAAAATRRTHLHVRAVDEATFPIAAHFDEFQRALDAHLRAGRVVLVHCRGGDSRAPALLLAYLVSAYRLGLRDAFVYLKVCAFCRVHVFENFFRSCGFAYHYYYF